MKKTARKVPQTAKIALLERAIEAISPAWAVKRSAARGMMEVAGRMTALSGTGYGYAGAGYSPRMGDWMAGVGDADADTVPDLLDLRGRSRDLIRNSPIAGGAIETQVSNIVGTGLKLQSRIDVDVLGLDDDQASAWQAATEREWRLWSESVFSDAMARLTFNEQQDLVLRSELASGDTFVLLASKKRDGWPFELALQVIEADRVSNERGQLDTATMVQGIEMDATGEHIAAHIADRHPGSVYNTAGTKWTRVPFRGKSGRRNLLHIMRMQRPGQTRGVPCLAPIIEPLKQLTRYSQAEVDAAVTSAALSLFAKMDPEAFTDMFDDQSKQQIIDKAMGWDGTIRPNTVVNLLPGEEITSPVQNRPNPNFDPFVSAVLKQIGIGLNIPHEVLTKHFQSSYSAARAALLDAWRTFRIRRSWLVSKFCQPVYEEWLADAVASGRIAAPGFFADPLIQKAWSGAVWSGDGPGALDPKKEAEAAEVRMRSGVTTLSEEIVSYDGGDWETKHRQQAREHDERVEAGLAAPVVVAPGTAAPSQAGAMPAEGEDPAGTSDPEDPGEQSDPTEAD